MTDDTDMTGVTEASGTGAAAAVGAEEELGLGLAGGGMKSEGEYRVLARKYRPKSFDELVGHEAMVRTLRNAFSQGRIAHAFILTGIRGIGKTTTARILARALNYDGPGSDGKPTIDMPELGSHCEAILESRHVDVLEMDAASRTGVDDIREIIESARYAPVSARYKVYIIDEVHMLSKAAFNALLKTLEEPPGHVKFIFATTEIRKVPITVLSRCQRFDLRRADAEELSAFLKDIAGREQASLEDGALRLIARAAEGSFRDGLSLLDQAIAHGGGTVSEAQVRDMLGLADRARVIDLFEFVMRGDVSAALGELRDQYDAGADPAVVLSDMAELTHWVTRLKFVPDAAKADATMTQAELERGAALAEGLGTRTLARAWQMLLKGLDEVRTAPQPVAAAEMVLIRLAHAADLPPLDEIIKSLQGEAAHTAHAAHAAPAAGGGRPSGSAGGPSGGGARAVARGGAAAAHQADPVSREAADVATEARTEVNPGAAPVRAEAGAVVHMLPSFEAVLNLAGEKRDIRLKAALERHVRLVSFERGRIVFQPVDGAPKELPQELARKLKDWTGERWVVETTRKETGAETVRQQKLDEAARRKQAAAADPLVAAVLEAFPGAEIVAVHDVFDDAAAAAAAADDGAPALDIVADDGDVGIPDIASDEPLLNGDE